MGGIGSGREIATGVFAPDFEAAFGTTLLGTISSGEVARLIGECPISLGGTGACLSGQQSKPSRLCCNRVRPSLGCEQSAWSLQQYMISIAASVVFKCGIHTSATR